MQDLNKVKINIKYHTATEYYIMYKNNFPQLPDKQFSQHPAPEISIRPVKQTNPKVLSSSHASQSFSNDESQSHRALIHAPRMPKTTPASARETQDESTIDQGQQQNPSDPICPPEPPNPLSKQTFTTTDVPNRNSCQQGSDLFVIY